MLQPGVRQAAPAAVPEARHDPPGTRRAGDALVDDELNLPNELPSPLPDRTGRGRRAGGRRTDKD